MDYTEEDIKQFEKEYKTVLAMKGQMSFIPNCNSKYGHGGHRFLTRVRNGTEYHICLFCPLVLSDPSEEKEEKSNICLKRKTGQHIFVKIQRPHLQITICRYCRKIGA